MRKRQLARGIGVEAQPAAARASAGVGDEYGQRCDVAACDRIGRGQVEGYELEEVGASEDSVGAVAEAVGGDIRGRAALSGRGGEEAAEGQEDQNHREAQLVEAHCVEKKSTRDGPAWRRVLKDAGGKVRPYGSCVRREGPQMKEWMDERTDTVARQCGDSQYGRAWKAYRCPLSVLCVSA